MSISEFITHTLWAYNTVMSILRTIDLTKRYGHARGIHNVNLNIEEGEIFGFIGPNGAGKSTTIRTLLGLLMPTSGSAEIFGMDIQTHGPQIRQQIGYLPSEVFYYDGMRVRDLLRYSASFYDRPHNEMQARITDLAARLNLDLSKKISDLSYGNKKKVGIVQGLLHSPRLIILDEPTGGLDPLMQRTFFDILREENQRGATILFSSHILSEVQHMCDRVAIIKDGEIIKTERMVDLRSRSYTKCRLELVDAKDAKKVKLDGISNFHTAAEEVTFLYQGPTNALTKLIASLDLAGAWLEEPELEEIFMHYYQVDDETESK